MNVASILSVDRVQGRVTLLLVDDGEVFRVQLTPEESSNIDPRLPRGATVEVEVEAHGGAVSMRVAPTPRH